VNINFYNFHSHDGNFTSENNSFLRGPEANIPEQYVKQKFVGSETQFLSTVSRKSTEFLDKGKKWYLCW